MAEVTLQEITFDTVRGIIELEVSEAQLPYVASNAVSLAEAQFNPGAWFRAIYSGNKPVGFVMLFDPLAPGAIARGPVGQNEIGLWRFMVDHRFQGNGYGRLALDLVCEHIRHGGKATTLLSSYIAGPDGPENFYMKYGFQKTGRYRSDGHEIEITYAL